MRPHSSLSFKCLFLLMINLSRLYEEIIFFSSNRRILGNGTLMILKSRAEDEGQYLCKADNGVGGGISKLAQVTVNGM